MFVKWTVIMDKRELVKMIVVVSVALFIAWNRSGAEAATATLDPLELQVLKNISQKYNYTQWTFDIDPCSSQAPSYWAGYLKCNCTLDNNMTCHIVQLYMFQKSLAGPFPIDSIKLQHLNYLDFGNNFLYGSLPSDLGTLTGLTHLGVGTNFFSGSIPPELGNLTSLSDLYMDSNEFSGEIPKEFSKLIQLKTLWLLDNNLSGSIPDIFQNATSLSDVRIYGNSLYGPIPASIQNLTSVVKLYIGDLTSGGPFPSGLENLQMISELSLRHMGLTGSIPASIGALTQLTILDLSFNNLTGEIPKELWNLKNLTNLYLGSNKLTGEIPENSSQMPNFTSLDLSFNQFEGTIPNWLEKSGNSRVNLIGNSFNGSSSNSSSKMDLTLLDCDNQTEACVQLSKDSSFAINVGGPAYNGSSIYYDMENETLGSASTFSNPSKAWLVSNIGQSNILTSAASIQGTGDLIVYQTARQSLSSLRYFGVGVDNGNYTVELQFAEVGFADGNLARRIFDVYIQGNIVLKDFNIQKAANGSYKSIIKSFQTKVSRNMLDIHFFWSGKGTCCIPNYLASFGPLLSGIQVYSGLQNLHENRSPTSSNESGRISGKVVAAIVAIVVSSAIVGVAIVIFVWRKKRKHGNDLSEINPGFINFQGGPILFSYNDLKSATSNFHPDNKLGQGGFGAVYKGVLQDGSTVAVKELFSKSKQGTREFMNEVTLITGVQHRNLVRLKGCCLERERPILVYEYLQNNSLDKILFDKGDIKLDWHARFNIILGTARGLAYLHEESQTRIVHRDIKASNILLDDKLQPKIADFGLARLFVDDQSHVSTGVAGTIGYLAPEYAIRGQLTEKADIYSFGVLVLEIVSGRKNKDPKVEPEREFLLDWAWNDYEKGNLLDLADPIMPDNYDETEILRVIRVALLCAQASPSMRPTMTRVVSMLQGDVAITSMPSKPIFLVELEAQIGTHPRRRSAATNVATDSSSYPSSGSVLSYSISTTTSANDMTISHIEPR
eukprot:c27668_g1_i1 orf=653-3664(-)